MSVYVVGMSGLPVLSVTVSRLFNIDNGVAVLVAQYSWPLLIVGLTLLLFRERLRSRRYGGLASSLSW